MSKLTSANAAALEAVGRVNDGGRKLPLALTIENDCVLRCVNADGFSVSVPVGGGGSALGDVECTLANGVVIRCMGTINRRTGTLRLDAVDQGEFYWFWLEVRPALRSSRVFSS
jgi:hypothetical protein